MDDEGDEETNVLDEDDNTTHGLERLSSAATCLVAGVEYTHGQQVVYFINLFRQYNSCYVAVFVENSEENF